MKKRFFAVLALLAMFVALNGTSKLPTKAEATEENPPAEAITITETPAGTAEAPTAETAPLCPACYEPDAFERAELARMANDRPGLVPSDIPFETPDGSRPLLEGETLQGQITFYDICERCCGKTDGITASGLVIKNGCDKDPHVAACNWLPFGSVVRINGVDYVIADRGGRSLSSVGHVDIFCPAGHEVALQLGRLYMDVTVISMGDGSVPADYYDKLPSK